MPAPFTALLLAGGRSTRMGRDKALLPHPVSGRPLLEHQAALLRGLPGCAELLLSAPAERGYLLDGPLAGARLVADPAPDCGPLGGLAAGLAAATTPRLLVLAVDLPFVTPAYLAALLWRDAVPGVREFPEPPAAPSVPADGEDAVPPKYTEDHGVAPRHADGAFEPLCALYPVSGDSRSAAASALARRELSLQRLLAAACAAGWMRPRAITEPERPLFANWNTPADL
jgi:molybdopterin-guanine dinucleotide biosynthesis protein A